MATHPSAGRFVGRPLPRREDPRLLTGRGTFLDDTQGPGMLHAAFLRSPVAAGRITHLDLTAARALDGVVAVLNEAEVRRFVDPAFRPLATTLDPTASGLNFDAPRAGVRPSAPDLWPRMTLLAGDRVTYVGEPIAVVVAVSRALAEDACDRVEIAIEPTPAVVGAEAAAGSTDRLVHELLGTNVAVDLPMRPDEALDAAFTGAAHVVRETIRLRRVSQAPLEARGIVASWAPGADELAITSANQHPHLMRAFAAGMLGVDEQRVRVSQREVGGSFGQKVLPRSEEAVVVLAARALGRTVKWAEDRWENLSSGGQARDETATVHVAADADGHILGLTFEFLQDSGASPPGGAFSTAQLVNLVFPGPYRVAHAGFTGRAVHTNTPPASPYRGPWAIETVARERVLDTVARRIGLDPAELRRRNVVTADDLPYRSATGMTYDRISPAATLEQALGLLDYDAFRAEQARARTEGRHLGVGISLFVEPTGVAPSMMPSMAMVLRVTASGTVDVSVSAAGHGQSLETTVSQLVAEYVGVDVERVSFAMGDTAIAPFGVGTGGSRMAVFLGGTARAAADALRARVFAVAAEMLEASPDDLDLDDGVVAVKGTPGRSVTLAAVAQRTMFDTNGLPPGVAPGLEVTARYKPSDMFTWSNACHVCTCEVDTTTGAVTILRYIVSEDCGTMINPAVVEGQVAGGVVQGIGAALFEHLAIDDHGTPLATTFLDYLVPTAADVPRIEVGHVETPSAVPGGFKGMGEGGAIGAPAAVLNAISDALAPFGIATLPQPATPAAIVDALRQAARET